MLILLLVSTFVTSIFVEYIARDCSDFHSELFQVMMCSLVLYI